MGASRSVARVALGGRRKRGGRFGGMGGELRGEPRLVSVDSDSKEGVVLIVRHNKATSSNAAAKGDLSAGAIVTSLKDEACENTVSTLIR